MRRLFLALVAIFHAGLAFAQGAVQQSGPVTSFHAPAWFGNGAVADAGTPSAPYLDDLGLFNGATCPFGISSQTTPGVSGAAYGLFTICQTAAATTLYVAGVGQSAPTFGVNIGGVYYPFPGTGTGTVTVTGSTPTVGNCAKFSGATSITDAGATCGSGSGGSPGGSSGNIQYNNAGAFGGGNLSGDCVTSILVITCTKTNGTVFGTAATVATGTSGATLGLLNSNLTFSGSDTFSMLPSLPLASGDILVGNGSAIAAPVAISGDCTLANTGGITCTKTSGTSLGTFATQNYATPPAIGGTTPAAGHFTTGSFTNALTTNVTGSTQCLQANSSGVVSGTGSACASGASGLVLLQTISPDGTKQSYTFSSLSGYADLVIVVRGKCAGTGVNFTALSLEFNSDTTSGNYYYSQNQSEGATFSYATAQGNPGSGGALGGSVGFMTALGFGDNPYMPSTTEITISNYNNTSWYKMVSSRSDMGLERYSWYNATVLTTMVWNNTAAITSMTLWCDADFSSGDLISLYGRNG